MDILIIDDHPLVREGLARILARLPEAVRVGEAGTAAEGLEQLRAGPWDLVLLDIALPDRSGTELLKHIVKDPAAPPVLILSSFPEEQYALRLLRAGARGYLNKEVAPDQLLTAIHTVLGGKKYLSGQLADHLISDFVGATPGRPPPVRAALSERESGVLRRLAAGRSTTQIAEEMALSVKTVSTYRSRILDKLRLQNNAELIAYALRNHLV